MVDKRFLSAIAPRFIIGVLAVSAAGALTGAAIGDLQPVDRGIGNTQQTLHRLASGAMADPVEGQDAPPDHYPLVTPEGTIPVEELALHGRLRNQLAGWWDYGDNHMLDADYPDQLSEAEIDRLAEWNPPPARTARQSVRAVQEGSADSARVEYVSSQERARPATVRPRQSQEASGRIRIESEPIEPPTRSARPPVIQIASEPQPAALN